MHFVKHPVVNVDTGEHFPSIRAAARSMAEKDEESKINSLANGILRSCAGTVLTAGGFRWQFEEDFSAGKPLRQKKAVGNHRKKRRAAMVDPKTKKFLKIFESAEEASKEMFTDVSSIYAACRYHGKKTAGYEWEYCCGEIKNGDEKPMRIKLDPGAIMPSRAHAADAGLDLYSPEEAVVNPGEYTVIDTGVHMMIPNGFVGLITSKSGLMGKFGITCRGTIDPGYTGSIKAVLFNHGKEPVTIHAGQKITQIVILHCIAPTLELTGDLGSTERGNGGFGSTGE